MVKVSVVAGSGSARFRVSVQAESTSRAVSLVAHRYPEGAVRVEFPIEPEGFFARESVARTEMAELPEKTAA